MAAFDVTVSPHRDQYVVGDVITCSARGFPTPQVSWSRDGGDDDVTVRRSNLSVSEEMMGDDNHWTCSAHNELSVEPATISVQFTVTGTD